MKRKIKVFVSTFPFGKTDPKAAELIVNQGWDLEFNPYGRKITGDELKILLTGADALIAGTEKLNAETLELADSLKLISRVGIGLDGIDWKEIKKRKIEVAYTPDAPTLSVAELTVGFMISLSRNIVQTSSSMRDKVWQRYTGRQLSGKVIGIIGLGRIGKKVSQLLNPFNCKILVNDIKPDGRFIKDNNLTLCEKKEIYKTADFITLHVPLTKLTHNLINEEVLKVMKKDSFLINDSRGYVVNEEALYNALKNHQIKGAAIDVYEKEPYSGPLTDLNNIILTCHMGSCTEESRRLMEIGAAQAVVDYFTGKQLTNRVPDEERKIANVGGKKNRA